MTPPAPPKALPLTRLGRRAPSLLRSDWPLGFPHRAAAGLWPRPSEGQKADGAAHATSVPHLRDHTSIFLIEIKAG